MVVDGTVGPFGEVGGIPDVIPMAMGEKEGIRFDFFVFEKSKEALRGIDGQPVPAEVDEVGVGGGEAAAEAYGFRHGVRENGFRLGLG